MGPPVGKLLGWILPVRCGGHRLLQHMNLVPLLPGQQLLHVIIRILVGGASAEIEQRHQESQKSQRGEEVSGHDPWLGG